MRANKVNFVVHIDVYDVVIVTRFKPEITENKKELQILMLN